MEANVDLMRRIASLAGRVFGITIGVRETTAGPFVFVDDIGDPVLDDGEPMVAAKKAEIEDGSYARQLPIRALSAAGVAKLQELERLIGAPEAGPGLHL